MTYTIDDIVAASTPEIKVCKTGESLFYNYGELAGSQITTGDIYVEQPVLVVAHTQMTTLYRPATRRDL